MVVSNAVGRRVVVLVVMVWLVASVGSVGVTAQPTGEHEPNDNRSSATPITDGGTGTITMSDSGTIDTDWFSFEAESGEAIRIAYSGDNVNYTLYRPDGKLVDVGLSGPGEGEVDTMGLVANRSGTYYVKVVNSSYSYLRPDSTVPYGFSVATANPDPFEPNERRDSAVALESGSQRNGTIFERDTDWFAVDAETGQNVTATVEYRSQLPTSGMNLRVDLFDSDGDRIGSRLDERFVQNRTRVNAASDIDTATQTATADRTGTYYVRVRAVGPVGGNDAGGGAALDGFTAYALTTTVNGTPTTGTPTASKTGSPTSLVIVGGTPANKVTYSFTYDGTVERSGTSHGAPIDDDDVTIDPDIDEISDSRVDGRLGGGGDAYLVSGSVTGLELDGDATAYLNGRAVDPSAFGDVSNRETATATETETPTPTTTATATETATATPTATRSPSPTPSPTAMRATETTASTTTTETTATTEATPTTMSGTSNTTGEPTTTDTESGRIVNGTATETSASSGPGFGLAVAFVVLAATGLLVTRRR